MSDSPHTIAVRKQDKLNRLAKERLRVANGKVEKYKAAPPAQDVDAVIAEIVAAETFKPGQLVEGRGVYLGTWTPKDPAGNNLSGTFNVFAAPEDLTDEAGKRKLDTYVDTVKHIAGLKNWHGHDGADYASDEGLFKDIKNGSYSGKWFIPTRDLLTGVDIHDMTTQLDSLFLQKNKGAFRNTFATATKTNHFPLYWSSTEYSQGSLFVWVARFSDGYLDWFNKNDLTLRCRPVRLEPVP